MAGLESGAIAAHCEEIRQVMGIIALLHAGDELGNRDVANAAAIVERELAAIERVASGRATRLPVMSLADVVAAERARRAPALRVIDGEGGRP
jgi:hypothetical protein